MGDLRDVASDDRKAAVLKFEDVGATDGGFGHGSVGVGVRPETAEENWDRRGHDGSTPLWCVVVKTKTRHYRACPHQAGMKTLPCSLASERTSKLSENARA